MTDSVLMAGDVDAIHEYVFETSSLPQIRGGSELLQQCEEQIRQMNGSICNVLYCGGGSFLLEVPSDHAAAILRQIEDLYRKKTIVATVTVVCEQKRPLASQPQMVDAWAARIQEAARRVSLDDGFARRLLFLNARIREAKLGKTVAPFYEALPFGKRCERCGKRAASDREPLADGKAVCHVCKRRDEMGRSKKDAIRGKFNQEFWRFWNRNQKLLGGYEKIETGKQPEQPQDLDELTASARRKYLSFFYADANDIGALLQRVKDPEDYRQVSKALEEGTKEALFNSLVTVCGQDLSQSGYWPFEIVNIGGDDVTVLVQAGYAWDLAAEFLECFEREVRRRLPEGLSWKPTASCGIAIADVKYPMRHFAHLAVDLLKRAKQRAKENPEDPRSAIDFFWLPSPIHSDKVDQLMEAYRPKPSIELTGRPYTLEEARGIRDLILKMARLPRTTCHRWAEVLAKGVLQSVSFIQYDLARDREGAKKMGMLNELSLLLSKRDEPPVRDFLIWHQAKKDQARMYTPLLDVFELAELRAMRADVREEE